MKTIELYTDGSGTSGNNAAGYGWVVVIDGLKYSEGFGHIPFGTNNDAELEAAIQGLIEVYKIINKPINVLGNFEAVEIVPPSKVELCSDSQIVLGWADGTYRFKQESKIEKYNKLQLLVKRMEVKTRWVKGHSGDEYNERCDLLANAGRLQIEPGQTPPKRSKIGTKTENIACISINGIKKLVDFVSNRVENYNEDIHGPRKFVEYEPIPLE